MEQSDLDIRIAALQQEYSATIASMAARGATLAAELASTTAKLKAAEDKLKSQEVAKDAPKLEAVS